MSENTERLERMAVRCDDDATSWRNSERRQRFWANHDEANVCGRMGDNFERDAAFLRSLIPLVEAGERAQWRPIESAPKLGVILLLVRSESEMRVFVAEWSWDDRARRTEWMTTPGWGGWNRLMSGWIPIGWQPLPAPPKEGA